MIASREAHVEKELFGRRAARSSVWVAVGFAGTMVLRLVSSVVLTRFIHPEVYGVMDLVMTLFIALHLFSDIGIIPCIVQSPRGGEPRHLNTVWTLQLLRSLVIFCVAAAIAVPVSKAYQRPILSWLIPAVATTSILDSLSSTGVFVLNRQVRRGRLVVMELSASVITLIVTVTAVYFWNQRGFLDVVAGRLPNLPFAETLTWTIVIGAVAGKVAWVGLSYLITPGKAPRLDLQRETIREVFGFGKWVFFATMLNFLAQQTDRFVAPKVCNFETSGMYGRALGLAGMGTGLIDNLASAIVFPTVSRAVESGTSPAAYVARFGIIAKLVSATVLSGLFVAGPSIVHVIYPATYSDVAWILQVLTVVGWFQCQSSVVGATLLGVGKPAATMVSNAAKLVALLVFAGPGVYLARRYNIHGITALILIVCAGDLVRYLTCLIIAIRMKLWGFWQEPVSAVIVGILAVGSMHFAGRLTLGMLGAAPQSKLDWVISMLAHGGTVVVVYGTIAAILWRLGRLRLAT